jgi:hypothetical protein
VTVDDREANEFYADPANLAVSGPGRKRQGQNLASMASVRFAPEVIEAVKQRAFREGVTVGPWIRRLVKRELDRPETRTLDLDVDDGALARLPADALERLTAALTPALMRHGVLELRIGPVAWQSDGAHATSSVPVSVQRPEGLIEGSGVKGEPRAMSSTLDRPRTFSCPHFSVGNVVSASCETCGPLDVAA